MVWFCETIINGADGACLLPVDVCCSLHFYNAGADEHDIKANDEEPSVIKGLLPCILSIGGVAIAIWLFIYFYVPPQSKFTWKSIAKMITS